MGRQVLGRQVKALSVRVLALVLVLLVPFTKAQPAGDPLAHFAVTGDPGSQLELAPGWMPQPVVRIASGLITHAPFWSSHWADTGQLAKVSNHPSEPKMLLKQPPENVLKWGKEYKVKPVVIATPHAVLVLSFGPMPAKEMSRNEKAWLQTHFTKKLKRRLNPVQVAHLFGLRYLRLEAQFKDLLCLDPDTKHYRDLMVGGHFGSKGRSELYVFPKEEPYREFGRHFFGAHGKHVSWWWHKQTESVLGALYRGNARWPEFHARFDHLVAHNLSYQFRRFQHLLPAWVPNGIAHYFAKRHAKHRNTYILLGTPTSKHQTEWGWDKDNWWSEVKTLVKSGEARRLTTLGIQTMYIDLGPRYHVQAWSLVNYMIGMGKVRFRTFLDVIMEDVDQDSILEVQQEAFLRAYGVNMVQFEKRWKGWVSRTKPPKRRRGR